MVILQDTPPLESMPMPPVALLSASTTDLCCDITATVVVPDSGVRTSMRGMEVRPTTPPALPPTGSATGDEEWAI